MKTRALFLAILVAALVTGVYTSVGTFADHSAEAGEEDLSGSTRVTVKYTYTAKALCNAAVNGFESVQGLGPDGSTFATRINILNPHNEPVTFAKKAIALEPGQFPIEPEPHVAETLPPNYGVMLDCNDVNNLIEGAIRGVEPANEALVVIETPVLLHVWAAYDTQQSGSESCVGEFVAGCPDGSGQLGLSLDVERVPAVQVEKRQLRDVPFKLALD